MDTGRPLNICVFSTPPGQSETFIRAHIQRLPGKVHAVFGYWFPVRHEDGTWLIPRPLALALRGQWVPALAGYTGPAFDLAERLLARYLRKQRVDVVLAEYGPVGAAVMGACQRAGVPLVVYFLGFDVSDTGTLDAHSDSYRLLFRRAHRLLAVSRDIGDRLVGLGAPRDKILHIPCGADIDTIRASDPAAAPPTFLAAARFVDKKAPHLTLLAFRKVLDQVPEARLVMPGDGPLWEACRTLASGLGLADRVAFPGTLFHGELIAEMQRARAFVQHSVTPSSGDREGTPVVILEAGAAGLPTVATRHGGIPEIVTDRETGLLVDEGDVAGMADCMIRLARDPALAARMGAAARRRVETEFSQARTLAALAAALEEAARSRSA